MKSSEAADVRNPEQLSPSPSLFPPLAFLYMSTQRRDGDRDRELPLGEKFVFTHPEQISTIATE